MRTPLIAGNWKMHHGVTATQAFLEDLINQDVPTAVEVVVCPPFVSLPVAAMLTSGSRIALGAQNVHWESAGAFTGEISAPMLIEIGVRWAIVGHSERRSLFGETDEHTIRRARTAQDEGLGVIVCIGESLAQREVEQTFDVLEGQIAGIDRLDPRRMVVAYEPVWAIGTGHNATPTQAQEVHAFLRQRMTEAFGQAEADLLRILYGGSLKPSNARELLAQPDVDGGLIGGASLDVDSFSAIIRTAAECAAGD
jgi:triosephosphate isomerase